ncbi:MAG: SprB repeat-containing protein, partial [Bacteroidia bacterium]
MIKFNSLRFFIFLFLLSFNGFSQTSFNFETSVTGYGTKNFTNTVSGKTLVVTSVSAKIYRATDYGMLPLGGSESALFSDGSPPETSVTFKIQGGQTFDLVSFKIRDETFSGPIATITTSKGSATFNLPSTGSSIKVHSSGFTNVSNFQGIDSFTLTSGSGFIFSLDSLVLTNIGSSTPTIIKTGTLTSFATCSGIASAQQSFTISGSNLTNNIVITPPTGFEVSTTSGSGFASSVTLNQSGGTVASTLVYVRLTNAASGTPSGNITCVSTGATTQNVVASGTVTTITATTSQTNVSCNGGSNGSATVTPSGGAGGYIYSWSPSGGTAATATGLSAGTYTCSITSNGCTITRNFTITQPTAISTATAAQTNVSCNGGSNGSASVTPSGGAGGYTYLWSPSGGATATTTGRAA